MWWLLGGLLIGSAIASIYWDEVRESSRRWLYENGLEDSFLMDILVRLDRFFSRVKSNIFARDYDEDEYFVEEQDVDIDKIDDPEILEQLDEYGYAEVYLDV